MALARSTCTADPTHDHQRRWSRHQWTCTSCTAEIRWYAGIGWHHYVSRRMDGVVFAEPAPVRMSEASSTSMPSRRSLYELEAELAAASTPARPHLYLVPPLAEPALDCANTQCPCGLTTDITVTEQSSALLAA